MAQALLNNLNIVQDSSFGSKDKYADANTVAFEKILGSKTSVETNTDTQVKVQTQTQTQTSTDIKANNELTSNEYLPQSDTGNNSDTVENSINIKTLGDLKSENSDVREILSNEIAETLNEAAAEAVVDINISYEGICEESTSADTETETTESADADTEETDITNEEPTMYTNTETLENPTMAVILQSQITVSRINPDNQQKEDTNLNTQTNLRDLKLTSDIRQSDSTQKDAKIINFSAKEDFSQIKESGSKPISDEVVKDLNIKSINVGDFKKDLSGNFMKNETPQEQAVKIMIQSAEESVPETEPPVVGEVSVSSVSSQPQVAPKAPNITNISSAKIVEQITKQMETMHNNSKVNIVLNPESLGKIQLQLVNSKEGLMAMFTVTVQETRDLLMKGIDGLRESLLSHGVNVDNVSVKLEETSDGEYKQDLTEHENTKGGNKNRNSKRQKQNEKPFEQMMFEQENNDKV